MTVEELIKTLQNYPAHDKVFILKNTTFSCLVIAYTNPCIPIPELPSNTDKM